jgi:SAM-dependent methyltransferase
MCQQQLELEDLVNRGATRAGPTCVVSNMGCMDDIEVAPAWQLMRLMDGFVTTQLLYVVARLGVADVLTDGPRTAAQIAGAVGADAGALRRVLRGLVIEDVLAEDDEGRFALTEVGASLIPMRGALIVRGEVYYRSAAGLLHSVREGVPAFERVYGERFFDHLAAHPDHEAAFQGSMAGRAEQEARDVVAAFDFTGSRRLVDVGGGRGILLAEILRAVPDLEGVLLDRDAALPAARAHLAAAGVGDRAECIPGDFFSTVPEGADAYLLSRVLHDWHDDEARQILATCRRAMPAGSRLLVVDAVLPERANDRPAAIRMDLHMLMLFGARERTEAESRALLHEAGFEVRRVVMTASPAGLGVIEATPVGM